jgi:hypothetical protein
MASDSEPKSGPADEQQASRPPTSVTDRPKKKKLKRPKPSIPKTEEEIDSPSKQTVGMLGILGILTVIMWAFARGGCNYHPPKETRVPRAVTTEELAHDAKNAAIELQQRWLTHDFTGALELASGDVVQEVEKDKAACDPSCLGLHKSLDAKLLTSAVVLDANMMGAMVRVTSVGLPEGPKVYLMRMERAESIWKATAHKIDDGTPLPALPTITFAAPANSGSAAPAFGSPHTIHPLPAHPAPAPAASK